MDENRISGFDAAGMQAGRDTQHPLAELAIGPGLSLALERLPDEERMIGARLGAVIEQPADIAAGERIDNLAARILQREGHGRAPVSDWISPMLGRLGDCRNRRAARLRDRCHRGRGSAA